MPNWQPSASLEMLRYRASINGKIRQFFAERGVLEVETPVLSQAAVSDPYLIPLQTDVCVPGETPKTCYLHTSPEYPMKRLLAAGSGSIYQLCKVFRNDECGKRHNPEFTLLEWYRVGFNEHQLMDEVEALYGFLSSKDTVTDSGSSFDRLSYRDAFQQSLQIDPHSASLKTLVALVKSMVSPELTLTDRDSCLEVLIGHVIEPTLVKPTFIYNFPASMAALAQKTTDLEGVEVARRFELYGNGVELANGYFELQSADEQRQRFEQDQNKRAALDVDVLPIDEHLIQALESGIPSCAGVALGIDRLLMVLSEKQRIKDVLSFGFEQS